MKKTAYLISIITLFVLLSACSNDIACKCIPPCMFPDTQNDAAPEWVCEAKLEGLQVSAVGSASRDKAVAGIVYMRLVAESDARTQLVQRMKKLVANKIKKYFNTTVDQEVINKLMVSVSQSITDKTLIGEKTVRRQVSPIGTMYVLLGINLESVRQTTQKAITTSMKNDPELWLQLKTGKDLDDLAAELVK